MIDNPSDAKNAVTGDFDFENEKYDCKQDQRHSRPIHRQSLQRVKSKNEKNAAEHTGQNRTGIRQLEEQSIDPEQHEDVGDVRI